jgi:hypothetical protein
MKNFLIKQCLDILKTEDVRNEIKVLRNERGLYRGNFILIKQNLASKIISPC